MKRGGRLTSPWGGKREILGRLETTPKCPECGKDLDGFASIDLDGALPKAGDASICLSCATPLEYYGSPLSLRRLEGEELILARAHPDFRKAERFVKKMIAQRVPNPRDRKDASR